MLGFNEKNTKPENTVFIGSTSNVKTMLSYINV